MGSTQDHLKGWVRRPRERTPCDTLRSVAVDGPERFLLDELSDRLETLRLLREDDPHRADVMLEQFGASGRVESAMLTELGQRQPIRLPERFPEAHRTVVRAIEVFDRNAARPPSTVRAGVLRPVAAVVVRLLVGMVVRSYQRSVIAHLRRLYALREANSVPGSAEYRMLTLARRQLDRVSLDLSRVSGGLPAFLAGGAVLSAVSSTAQQATGSRLVLVVVAVITVALSVAAFWCVLTAAGIARRRTRIALDAPLRALYATLGAAGDPPRDKSRTFVMYAVLLLAFAWVIAPIALTLAFTVI